MNKNNLITTLSILSIVIFLTLLAKLLNTGIEILICGIISAMWISIELTLNKKEKPQQSQQICNHPNHTTSYDPKYDFDNHCYWARHTCSKCKYTWSEELNKL